MKFKSKHITILLIDDDPVFVKVLEKSIVENINCTLICYENARICLHERPPKPDLVLIDYVMNDIDGLRASRLLKKRWKEATFILISSSDKIVKKPLTKFGIDAAVLKSDGIPEIISTGLKFLKARRFMRRLFYVGGILLVAALLALYFFK